jgi:hypothetical protein
VLVASNDCLTISQADSPIELHDGHASQSSRCCCFGIRGLTQLWMCSVVGQCYYAVDAAVKVLHLLRWNSVCLRILHKAVHADHELGGCEDHLLRLKVWLVDCRFHTKSDTHSRIVGHLRIARGKPRVVGRQSRWLQSVSVLAWKQSLLG